MIILLLTNIVNASNQTKCVSLINQKCKIQSTLINLHPNEYNQEFHYYPFGVKFDTCVESCNTLNDLLNSMCLKECVLNETEDLHMHVFNMITEKNEQKMLTKDVNVNVNLMEKFLTQIKKGIIINVDESAQNIIYVKKIIFGMMLHVVVVVKTINI